MRARPHPVQGSGLHRNLLFDGPDPSFPPQYKKKRSGLATRDYRSRQLARKLSLSRDSQTTQLLVKVATVVIPSV